MYLFVEVDFNAKELFGDAPGEAAREFDDFLKSYHLVPEKLELDNDLQTLKEKFQEQYKADVHRYIWVALPEDEEVAERFIGEVDTHPLVIGHYSSDERITTAPVRVLKNVLN